MSAAVTLRVEGGGAPKIPLGGLAGVLYAKDVGGVAHLHFKTSAGVEYRLSPAPQSITGATAQLQIDSIVSALVALGLATDNR